MRHTRYQGAIVRDNSILLIRHLSRSTGNRYWVVPGGGIEAGETEIACVEREMREETALDVRVERLLVDAREQKGRFYRRQKTFLCTPIGGTAAPGVEPEAAAANFAITDVRWFDLADPASWFEHITEKEWVVPLLWEIREALGYAGGAPAGVERLDILAVDDREASTGSPRVRVARETDLRAARRILRAARESLVQPAITEWPEGDPARSRSPRTFVPATSTSGRSTDRRWASQAQPKSTGPSTARFAGAARERPSASIGWRYWPDNRRQGIASHLLRRLEHRARSLRYSAIRIDACTSNAPAIALCESRGYHRVGMVRYAAADFVCFERSCRKPPKE